MSGRLFSLVPFTGTGFPPGLEITGSVIRLSNTLCISYLLSGPVERLAIPAPADIPARENALWENTCFELFIALKGSGEYREFNLSPSGHWNVYRFEAYRQGMKEERSFDSLPFHVLKQVESFSLDLAVDLKDIFQPDQPLEIAVTAVIKSIDGELSYWALTHEGPQPDFHRREGFIIELR
jgi:hypothetical protein